MYGYYNVVKGDTLTSIANKFKTTVEDIAEINKLDPLYVAKVGDRLLVPLTGPPLFGYHRVLKGETLYKIANDYKTDLNNLVKLNGLELADTIYEGDLLLVPKEGVLLYITGPGDTLKSVSEKLGVSENVIVAQNASIYLLEDQLILYKK